MRIATRRTSCRPIIPACVGTSGTRHPNENPASQRRFPRRSGSFGRRGWATRVVHGAASRSRLTTTASGTAAALGTTPRFSTIRTPSPSTSRGRYYPDWGGHRRIRCTFSDGLLGRPRAPRHRGARLPKSRARVRFGLGASVSQGATRPKQRSPPLPPRPRALHRRPRSQQPGQYADCVLSKRWSLPSSRFSRSRSSTAAPPPQFSNACRSPNLPSCSITARHRTPVSQPGRDTGLSGVSTAATMPARV
jgi:hypothetical protein